MSALKRNWGWIVAALVLALGVYAATVLFLPRIIMNRTMGAIAHATGVNTMAHGKRPTARSRGVVRPSPDLLYSTCIYDLEAAHGVLHVHAQGMPATYWSVSAFDAETNNFHVENDRQAKNGGVDFLLIAKGAFADGTRLPVVISLTNRGIILFRTLINDETHFAEIDAARRHARCEPFAATGP